MSYNFKAHGVEQMYCMPPSILDWVDEEGLGRFVYDTVTVLEEEGKLKGLYAGYAENGVGGEAYHPMMLLCVLLYAYCVGITSSRKIAAALEGDVNLRFLSGNQQPDFRTISDFRKRHVEVFEDLFVALLSLCKEVGLVKVGRVSLDGTKIEADAALDQNRTKEGIEKEVKKILEEAEKADKEEDERYGKEKRGDELPEDLRKSSQRLGKLKQAHRVLSEREAEQKQKQAEKIEAREEEEKATGKKKRGRKPKTPEAAVDREKKVNLTDSDSRIQKTRKGYIQGYNAQIAVDTQSQVIVGQDVTEEENDYHQLKSMIDKVEEQAGEKPEELLADAGYSSDENLELEAETGIEFFIPDKKDWKRRQEEKEKGEPRGRIPKNLSKKERMARKLRTKRGREIYKKRGKTVEPVFGQIKNQGGQNFRRFRLRSKRKVKGEWSLVCSGHNVLKLFRSGLLRLKLKSRVA